MTEVIYDFYVLAVFVEAVVRIVKIIRNIAKKDNR